MRVSYTLRASSRWSALLAVFLLFGAASPSHGAERLRLAETSLHLPGAPAAIVATDLDGDGRSDLAIFVVGNRWGEKVTWERSEMDDVEGLVEAMTVVPSLLDRRELWVFFGEGNGRLRAGGAPLEMPLSVLSLARGPASAPLLALTDEGVASIAWELGEGGDGALRFRPLLEDPSILAGSGTFLSGIRLIAEVTGDDLPDLLLPARDGIAVYPGTADGFAAEAIVRGLSPALEPEGVRGAPVLSYPLPEVRDVTGDGRPDLVWRDPGGGWKRPWVAVNRGSGGFSPPESVLASLDSSEHALAALDSVPTESSSGDVDALYFGDVEGNGHAELVVQVMDPEPDDLGMRKSIAWAESPPGTVFVHRTDPALSPSPRARSSFRIQGYADTGGDSDFELPGGLRDLDGDGRIDLVTLSPQISVTRLLGGLALGRVALPTNFHVWCQEPNGAFRAVEGLDLSGKFRLDIGDLKIRNLPSFAGDFDGDGRIDFVQLGRGRKVTIHSGGDRCAFPSRPDLTLRLKKEPAHIDLVRVEDLDGDGRSDLVITHALERREASVLPPTRLDLYLSGDAP